MEVRRHRNSGKKKHRAKNQENKLYKCQLALTKPARVRGEAPSTLEALGSLERLTVGAKIILGSWELYALEAKDQSWLLLAIP